MTDATLKRRTPRRQGALPAAVAAVAAMSPDADATIGRFAASGYRTLAVAAGPPRGLAVIGLIGLSDPPRRDSAGLLTELRSLGVRAVDGHRAMRPPDDCGDRSPAYHRPCG